MERNEVIKALECCITPRDCECDNCPLDKYGSLNCKWLLMSHSLALIKELTEELTHKETAYNELYELTTEEIKDLYAERDRLTEENERLIAELAKACKALDTGKENVE